ncbi:hypothetical protein MHU86_4379 [Fragilaria crotonensis]|nr:hypothetical protein MHU86_4379 [Fragilaria crotonensis]
MMDPAVQLLMLIVSLLIASTAAAFTPHILSSKWNYPIQFICKVGIHAHGRTDDSDVNSNSNWISNATSKAPQQWNDFYQEFLKYKNETGHAKVPLHHPILGNWVRTQRMHYKQWQEASIRVEKDDDMDDASCHHRDFLLTPERYELLQSAGFIFHVKDHEWMEHYQALVAAVQTDDDDNDVQTMNDNNDNGNGRRHRMPEGTTLGMWIKNQRMQYKRGTLSKERIELLHAIDFCWNPNEWQYRENVRQVQMDSTSKSIADWKLTDGPLGLWMSRQRTQYKKYCREDPNHGLQPYQIQLLEDELGFDSSLLSLARPEPPDFVDWSDRMRQLQEFKRDHGHLNVPRTYTKHAKLGSWVAKVRERYRHYGASSSPRIQERLQDLYDIGFIWDVLEYKWQQRFQQLIDFYELHGHVDVPDGLSGLGPWVKEQRREFNKIHLGEPSRLTPKHAMALNRIGLDWNRQRTVRKENQQVFMKRLQEWRNCSQTDGLQTLPSVHSLPTQSLRNWVERQRKLYRKWLQGDHDMSEERRRLLEDAGVVHGIVPNEVIR